MQGQPTGSASTREPTPEATSPQLVVEQAIMALLLSGEHAGIWMCAEVEREIDGSLAVQDALVALHAGGLVNLHGELVIPSRAARRMDELAF